MRIKIELIRRLANVKIKQCYLAVFKNLVYNKIDYNVNSNGVFFEITTMTDDILHGIEQILKQPERKKEGRKDNDA